MTRPRLLDLFCGAGGAGVGYTRAGFDVVGVDLHPQPRYPFDFHKADAMTYPLDGFDVIHASPPCQGYSALKGMARPDYPRLIKPLRERLRASGTPYVIENVERAPLINALLLCGTMFGLLVYRHRLFESYPLIGFSPMACHHWAAVARKGTGVSSERPFYPVYGSFKGGNATIARVMGIDHYMRRVELAEAIPPAYTEYVGRQLRAVLGYQEATP